MRYAICNELFEAWTHERTVDFVAEVGYTGIEVAPFTLGQTPTQLSATARKQFRETTQSAGLEVLGLHWLLAKTDGFHLNSPDASVRKRTLDYLIDLANLTADLGGNLMVLGSPQQRNIVDPVTAQEATDYTVATLRELDPTLERNGVVLAVEPLGPEETNFIQTAAEGQAICEQVGSANVRLHLDVKAMSTESQSIDSIIRQQAGNFAHFHANDPNRQGPGTGEVDFLPIFHQLKESGYSGWVSVEVFDFSAGPEAIAKGSLEYMRQIESKLSMG
jgi:sugar phosphate isomerase/epimerase